MMAATVTEGFQMWVMRVLDNEATFYRLASSVAQPYVRTPDWPAIDALQNLPRFPCNFNPFGMKITGWPPADVTLGNICIYQCKM
jgi:hypothetical protein